MSDVTELVDKNIERLVEAVKAAGPSAEYAFTETVAKISVEAWVQVVMPMTVLAASIPIFIFFLRRGFAADYWGDEQIAPVVSFGMAALISILFVMVSLPDSLSKALHPVGYLVLKTLN